MGIISLPDKTTRNFFRVLPLHIKIITFHSRIDFLKFLFFRFLFSKFQMLPKVQTGRYLPYLPISTVPHSPLPFPKHPHHLSLHPSDLEVHFLLLWYLWYLQYLVD